jgi:hypothetical protein
MLVPLVVVGCTGGAQVALRQPVAERCQAMSLYACDDLTRGAVLYADGSEDAGRAVLVRGLARNRDRGPELEQFATSLETLRNQPVAEEYADSLAPAIELIRDSGLSATRGARLLRAMDGQPVAGPRWLPVASREPDLAKPAMAERLSGFLAPVGATRGRPCDANGPPGATCVVQGLPADAVVTDLVLSPACPYDVFVFSGSLAEPRWLLWGAAGKGLSEHGTHLPIKKRGFIVAGAAVTDKWAEGEGPDLRCGVTWVAVPAQRSLPEPPFDPLQARFP